MHDIDKLIIMTSGTVAATWACVWALTKFIEKCYNIKAIHKAKKGLGIYNTGGIVYNKQTKKLEPDNSIIVPFGKGSR